MQQQGQLGFKIDPDAHYDERALELGLSLTKGAQDHMRRSGLRHSMVGGPNNASVIYRGKDLIDFFARSGLAQ